MKALNTDAVRRLYHGKLDPSQEGFEVCGKEINSCAVRIALALSAVSSGLPNEARKLTEHCILDMEKLRELEREDAFVKGFRTAVELMERGELHNAAR